MEITRSAMNVSEIRGFDIDNLNNGDIESLKTTFNNSAVTILREFNATPESQIRLTHILGEPVIHHIEAYRHKNYPEIVIVTAAMEAMPDDAGADDIVGLTPYHADLSFQDRPSPGSLLSPVDLPPEDGNTGFIDASVVYEALSDNMKSRIKGLKAIHCFGKTRETYDRDKRMLLRRDEISEEQYKDSAMQPLAFKHPESGRSILYISPLFISEILGISREASDQLIGELCEFSTQERFIYIHEWKSDDLVMWNNLQALHSGRGHKKKYSRVMYRTQLKGTRNLIDYII